MCHDQAVSDPPGRLNQEVDGLGLAIEQLQVVGSCLYGRAVPGPQHEGLTGGSQSVVVKVFQLAEARPFNPEPSPPRRDTFGLGQVPLGSVEVAEPAQRQRVRRQPVSADLVHRRLERPDPPEELPGRQRPPPAKRCSGPVVARLRVGRIVSPGPQVQRQTQAAGAQLTRQPPGHDSRGRPTPPRERGNRLGDLVGRQAVSFLIQGADAVKILAVDRDRPLLLDRCHHGRVPGSCFVARARCVPSSPRSSAKVRLSDT